MESGNTLKLRMPFPRLDVRFGRAIEQCSARRERPNLRSATIRSRPDPDARVGPDDLGQHRSRRAVIHELDRGHARADGRRRTNVEEHVFGFDNTWEIDSNWKVFQDNTIECYHCPTTHPELARVLEMKPEKQEMFVGGKYWIHHIIPFRPAFHGSLTTQRHAGKQFNYYYHWVFPTTYCSSPGAASISASSTSSGSTRSAFATSVSCLRQRRPKCLRTERDSSMSTPRFGKMSVFAIACRPDTGRDLPRPRASFPLPKNCSRTSTA